MGGILLRHRAAPPPTSFFDPVTLGLSGFWPDEWSGTTHVRRPGVTVGDVLGPGAYSGWALVRINSISTNITTANQEYQNDVIWTPASGYVAVYLRSNGGTPVVGLAHYDGTAPYKKVEHPITLGQWVVVHWRFTGAAIQIGVNGVWSSPVSAAPLQAGAAAQVIRIFRRFSSSDTSPDQWTNGRIREQAFRKATLSDDELDDVLNDYMVGKYNFPTGLEAPVQGSPFAASLSPNGHSYTIDTFFSSGGPWPSGHDGVQLRYFASKWRSLGGWTGGPPSSSVTEGSHNRIFSAADPSVAGNWVTDHALDASPPTSGPGACWSRRHCFAAEVLDGYLHVFGGDLAVPNSAAVAEPPWTPSDHWRTADGLTWERLFAALPIDDCAGYVAGVYQGALHMIGGTRGFGRQTIYQHWKYTTAAGWVRLPDPPFAVQFAGRAIEHDGHLVVISGSTEPINTVTAAVWAYNGTTWAQQTANAAFTNGGRTWIDTASYDGKLWAFGGRARPAGVDTEMADSWHSENLGQTWISGPVVPWIGGHACGVGPREGYGILFAGGYNKGTACWRLRSTS